MKKLYTLKEEIVMAGLNGNVNIGIDDKTGLVVKSSITIDELLKGRYKTLLNKKVKNVFHGDGNPNMYVFVLNSK